MKRVVLTAIALVALAVSWPVANAAQDSATLKVKICHRTTSKTKPYRLITVKTRAALRGHTRHGADIVPAPAGGCPRTVLSPTAGGQQLRAFLLGGFEQPEAGDSDGVGQATFRLQRGLGRVCFVLGARSIVLPSAGAHIHLGEMGKAGDIVVQLAAPGASGTSRGCSNTTRALVGRILSSPAGFYANVHTTDFPNGAIRGQLEAVANGTTVFAQGLTGAQEVPRGDPDGQGAAVVRITGTQVCFTIAVRNILLPSVGAHIHRAPAGVAGAIVVPFTAPDASGVSSGCATADAALAQEITANPAGFYVNVHSRDFPGGAVRGQLTAP